MTLETHRLSLRAALTVGVFLGLLPLAALAHTLGEPAPFHLSPGDHFRIPVVAGTFSDPATVQIRFSPVGGGADTNQTPEDVVANTSVGVRVPAALAVGQYDVSVLLSGTPSDAPVRIWVRQRPFRMIRRSSVHLPGAPAGGVNFKDTDFADVDNDGFLDIFQANSLSGSDVDRLQLNQRGKAPGDRDCIGSSDFCDMTVSNFENTVAGVDPGNRTYDADLVDLDLDSDLDLVRIDRGSAPIRVFLNDGTGTFRDRTITRPGIGPALLPSLATISGIVGNTARVDSGDVDGDGRPDLVTCSWSGSGQNLLLLNRLHSGGGFVIANDDPCNPASPTAHALCRIRSEVNRGCGFGDFNNDDRLDIIAPTMDPDRPDFVLLNTGNNGSGIPQFDVHDDWVQASGGGAQEPRNGGNVMVADVDGDGDDDVLVASPRDEQKRRILWNDNGTRLVELADARYPFAGDSYDAQLADLDRDGDLDVFTSPEGGSGNPILINRGGRNANMRFEEVPAAQLWFAEGPGDPTPTSPSFNVSLSPGDYDLDGDLDLLTGGYDAARLWRSDLFDQPGEDRDWVFVLDRTRSMISGGRDFFEPSKNVLKTFLSQRRPGDDAGLVTFDYAGTQPSNPNAPDDVTKAQVEAEVGVRTIPELQTDVEALSIGSCSGFCTAIGWAIKTGKEVAEGSPDADREKVVVLLTDGEQNQGPHPDTIIPTIPSNIRLYTIALGSDTDDRMLSALATNGGKFYFAGRSSDYASVQSALREIDEDLEGHSTGKQPLIASSRWTFFPVLREVLPKSPLLRKLGNELALFDPPSPTAVPVASRVDAFVVDPEDRQVRFTLSWRQPSRTNRMVLTDPKGRTYPLAGDTRVREQRTDKSHVIEVADPLSGVWLVRPQVNPDSGPAKVTATASTDLRLVAEPFFPLFYVREPILVRAALLRAPAGTQAQAVLTTPSKRTLQAMGRPNQKGVFEFQFDNAGEPGTYKVEMVVVGPPQRPFIRTWHSAIHVAEPSREEPDLRKAELTLDRTELAARSGTATAVLRLRRLDGSPLSGATVTFLPTLGRMTGEVKDLGDGRYTQTLAAGDLTGAGMLRARVALTRLPNEARYRVLPGKVDPKRSTFSVIVGPLKLCAGESGSYALRVVPVDAFGNPLHGAKVDIRQTSGPRLSWVGPAEAVGQGEVYQRRFRAPARPGRYTFAASVEGVPVAEQITLPAFQPESREGKAMGCTPKRRGGRLTRGGV